jgi:DNA polymerase I-like protein with 3'-5' exonuclease and polymerase domains
MIYLVSSNQELFDDSDYKHISVDESLEIIKSWNLIQFDTETSGRDAHIDKLLCAQFGNKTADIQIVVDCVTTDIRLYKDVLESKLVIGQNLKFDLQFLYNYGIIPLNVYDTMIVEQLLYLGYPSGQISFSLKEIAWRRLGINIDKTVRGEIIWRGLDKQVILYAAGDVTYLEDIMWSQVKDCREKKCMVGAKLECDFVPAIAYLEWCGIHLDEKKWKEKMVKDKENLNSAINELNKFVVDTPSLSKFTYINRQGDLFAGYCLDPQVTINWSSSRQVIEVAKILGFNTQVKDKKTGEDKDSVLEKHLASQKGVNDEFLKLYFNYQEYAKVVSSFGQGHLNAINPKTNRIHTVYKQLGAASGRMSCGSQQPNTSLAKLNKVAPKDCTYPNIQQLPHDEETRACFTSMKGNLWVSCDYSAQEGRVQGDIYQDEGILKMYREGIDGHSMYAKIFFKEELKDIDVHDVKKLRPDLGTKAKGPEFALAYGGGYTTIMQQLKCSEEEAKQIVTNYEEGFKGTTEFAKKGSAFVRKNGYILMCPLTGHRMYWWDHDKWLERQKSFTQEFWEEYRNIHKGTGDAIAQEVSMHFRAASKFDRLARNAPPQGTSAVMTKEATTNIFHWIVKNGYFGKILCCALVHDETNWEYPEEVKGFPNIVKSMMESSAAKYCKSIEIPAEASVGTHWIH